jgi:undecaprenyl-diphosphatase
MTLRKVVRSIRVGAGWLARHELGVLLGVLVVAGGLWGFAELADEVMEGETHALDRRLILALRAPDDLSDPLGAGWVEEMARDMTALGGVGVLGLLTIAVTGFLWLHRKRRAAVFVLVAVMGGVAISQLLKLGFDRPRPDLVPHGSITHSASFPSGHSMLSAVTYLTLGALLARFHGYRRDKLYLLGLALLIMFVVGISRVYLGVHWPTDVLAGWTLGVVWAVLCWIGARWLQRRGELEGDGEG